MPEFNNEVTLDGSFQDGGWLPEESAMWLEVLELVALTQNSREWRDGDRINHNWPMI